MIGKYLGSDLPAGRVTDTVGTMLLRRVERRPEHPVFAMRAPGRGYEAVSWQTLLAHVSSIACFLRERGIDPADRVAVYSPNSYRMLVWELAVTAMGAVSVPIYAGHGRGSVEAILLHSEPGALYVDGESRLANVEACRGREFVHTLVTGDPSKPIHFDRILEGGSVEAFRAMVRSVDPEDVAFIQYTSGTTGDPKGVMLRHRNILSQQLALEQVWEIRRHSRFLSYLPWHHSFGGLFERFTALYQCATLYLEDSLGKNIHRLIQNWRIVRPTQFFSVPKVYVELVAEARLNPEIREILFHPDLKFVFTAAAPLPRECGEYFKSHGVAVLEGWGLTETSPCVTLTAPGRERVHSFVGDPIPGCEIVTDQENEIYVRGPNVMKGYYKDPERTKEAIDGCGWFHTGDLGEISDYGLRIICRLDGLFKLSSGEKVSSMLVENALTLSARWIENAVAMGSGEGWVSALIFPNFQSVASWAKKAGKEWSDDGELVTDPDVQELIADEVRSGMLDFQPKFMAVKAFAIIPKQLGVDAGELTPTMKVIRHRVAAKYASWGRAIYRPEEHPDLRPHIVYLSEDPETASGDSSRPMED